MFSIVQCVLYMECVDFMQTDHEQMDSVRWWYLSLLEFLYRKMTELLWFLTQILRQQETMMIVQLLVMKRLVIIPEQNTNQLIKTIILKLQTNLLFKQFLFLRLDFLNNLKLNLVERFPSQTPTQTLAQKH